MKQTLTLYKIETNKGVKLLSEQQWKDLVLFGSCLIGKNEERVFSKARKKAYGEGLKSINNMVENKGE